jgi:hypothetical protein
LLLLSYSSTFQHGFVFDDTVDVVNNPAVHGFGSIRSVLTTSSRSAAGLETGLYRPLTSISFMVDYSIAGTDASLFHVSNLVIHAAASVLVMFLAMALGLPVAASGIAALIFALHPAHVEVVANVAGRKESLMAGLLVGAVLARLRGLRGKTPWLVGSAALYLAAMLTKETAVVGAALVVAVDGYAARTGSEAERSRRYLSYWLWAVALGLYVVLRWNAVGGVALADIPYLDNPAAQEGLSTRILTGISTLGLGARHLAWPIGLSPDYSFNAWPLVTQPSDLRFLLPGAALAGIILVAVRYRRIFPILGLATAWYILAVLPGSNLLLPIGTVFGDRLLYLPSIGLALLLAAALAAVPHGLRRPLGVFAAGLAALLGVLAASYAAAWKDQVTLFEYAVEVVPNSAKVRYNLGTAYAEAGRFADAENQFTKAIAIYPEASGPHNQLGNIHLMAGRSAEARRSYERAVEYEDRNAEAHYNLALRLDAEGDHAGAAEHLRRFLELAASAYPEQAEYARTRLGQMGVSTPYP